MQPINIYNSPDVKVTIDENGTPVDVYVSGGSSLSIAFYSTYSALPSPGQEGILYITEDTNFIYRWDGTLNAYIQVGGGAASLQDVTDVGNTTTNDIQLINDADVILGAGGKILMDNGSKLQEGTTDAGNGGSKGIALKCSVDYELKWEAGRLYTMEQDGFTIREVSHNFTFAPSVNDDDSKGFVIGSRWILDNGDIYTCTDATTGTAVWSLEPAKVPYTGAIGNVNLGEYGVSGGYYQFDTTPTEYTQAVGNVGWNDTDGTIEMLLKGGSVVLEIGQKLVSRVVNGTGGNVLRSNYQVVKVTGAQGQRLQVNLAQGNNDANSADTLGLIAENISNNQSGFIVTSGIISEINTTGSLQSETWADGDPLYLSPTTAGKVTNVKPQAPNHTVIIGFVVYAHSVHGKIFVKIDNGYELDELHNVKINTPLNGQVLRYNGTTFVWENSNDSDNLTFNAPLSRSVNTISISQASASANGYLSSTDWSTFNSKEPALTKGNLTESTSSVLTISGGSSAVIGSGTTIQVKQASSTQSGYLSSTDWTTFNGKQNALTNPVTGTGTNNEIAYFNTTGSTIGSLSTATYPSLTELSYVKGVTSAIQTQLNGKQSTLTNPITGTGTSGQVAYFNGTTTQTGSNNLFWDATNNRLGIGGSPGAYSLDVNGTARVQDNLLVSKNQNAETNITVSNTTAGINSFTLLRITSDSSSGSLEVGKFSSTKAAVKFISSNDTYIYNSTTAGDISILNDFATGKIKLGAGGSSTAQMTLFSTGNVSIGSTIDTASLFVSKNQNTATGIQVSNTTSGTGAFSYFRSTSDSGSGYIEFGKFSSTTTAYKIISSKDTYLFNNNIAGDLSILNDFATGKIKLSAGGSSTAQATLFSTGNLAINQTTDSGYKLDVNGTARVSGQITTTTADAQFGNIGASTGNFRIHGVNGGTYAFAVYSSNTLRFGVVGYGGLTSNNNSLDLGTSYLSVSQIRLGENVSSNTLSIKNTSVSNNAISIKSNNGVSSFTIPDSGNVLINTTTDSGYKLDVNGTLRSQGDFTLSDAKNLILGSTTGTKIGTATSQKIGFWNATPIVQPTTAVAASTLVGGGGTTLTDTDTFDGYTLKQIVKALRNTGILA